MDPFSLDYMGALNDPNLKSIVTDVVLAFFLMMARITPLMFLTPILGSRHAPAQVKIGKALLFTFIVFMPVYSSLGTKVPQQLATFIMLMLKEMAIGMLIGFVISLIFHSVMMAGRIMDTAATRSMAEVQAPHMKARATPLGDIAYMFMIVLFFATGGHLILIDALLMSFTTFNILDFTITQGALHAVADRIMWLIHRILYIAVLIAAPVMVATFLADLTFGLLNRVAPQLNAYFMSMPVKALGSIIILFIAFETVAETMENYVVWVLEQVIYVVRAISL